MSSNRQIILPPLKPSSGGSHYSSPSLHHLRPIMSAPSKRCDISTLLSPPGKTVDSFGDGRIDSFGDGRINSFGDGHDEKYQARDNRFVQPQLSDAASISSTMALPTPTTTAAPVAQMDSSSRARILSPPTTPSQPDANSSVNSVSNSVVDPIIYPSTDTPSSDHPAGLFGSVAATPRETPTSRALVAATPRRKIIAPIHPYSGLIDQHIARQTHTTKAPPPSRADYEAMIDFVQALRFNGYSPAKKGKHQIHQPARIRTGARQDRVLKPSRPKTSLNHPALAAAARNLSLTSPPFSRTLGRSVDSPTATRRAVAPSREDKDFGALPDYCPPILLLDNQRPGCFRVEWKGHAITLDNDPHRNLLHPEELQLAGTLRLDCATYLTSKRRIFIRRVECVRNNKEFRKTDAQQACKIDVNKASKLWSAYERVGWLDKKWVARWV